MVEHQLLVTFYDRVQSYHGDQALVAEFGLAWRQRCCGDAEI